MSADIDIDMADRQQLLKLIRHVPAQLKTDTVNRIHNSGIYATEIPWDPINQCAAIDYEEAEQRGYFKIDLLNMSVYSLVTNTEHYELMLNTEPPWSRLWEDRAWASQLVHVGNYGELLKSMQPDSIPRMAAFISIIRPGKAHLQNKSWTDVFESVWDGDSSKGFVFKKSQFNIFALGYFSFRIGIKSSLSSINVILCPSSYQG
jgi:hypothetical protein